MSAKKERGTGAKEKDESPLRGGPAPSWTGTMTGCYFLFSRGSSDQLPYAFWVQFILS